jgi:hypothetical protein
MYGKIFDSMYEGTLYGHWEAIITLQQMLVLCTSEGVIDMTPQAISARTSIPLDIITKGIGILSEPDPYSRTPGEEGRRIDLIDAHRPWGWYIVNHAKYRNLQDADTVRDQTRERVRRHREMKRSVTDGNGEKRHTDTTTETDALKATPPLPPLKGGVDKSSRKAKDQPIPGWWESEAGTIAEGARQGKPARPGESMADYRGRLRLG